MKKFISDRRGETLVEVLAAILIFTLSSIILYSMVTTASGINMKAQEKDQAVQIQTKIAENAVPGAGVDGKFTLTLVDKAKNPPVMHKKEFSVSIFKDDTDDSMYSYHGK